MELYREYLQSINENARLFHSGECFVSYRVLENGSIFIIDMYSKSLSGFDTIIRHLIGLKPKSVLCEVVLNQRNTERLIYTYSKVGFRITDGNKDSVTMECIYKDGLERLSPLVEE